MILPNLGYNLSQKAIRAQFNRLLKSTDAFSRPASICLDLDMTDRLCALAVSRPDETWMTGVRRKRNMGRDRGPDVAKNATAPLEGDRGCCPPGGGPGACAHRRRALAFISFNRLVLAYLSR